MQTMKHLGKRLTAIVLAMFMLIPTNMVAWAEEEPANTDSTATIEQGADTTPFEIIGGGVSQQRL